MGSLEEAFLKKRYKGIIFWEPIKLVADKQKPILPCTENKDPCLL